MSAPEARYSDYLSDARAKKDQKFLRDSHANECDNKVAGIW